MKTKFLIVAITILVALGTLSFTLTGPNKEIDTSVNNQTQDQIGGLGDDEIL